MWNWNRRKKVPCAFFMLTVNRTNVELKSITRGETSICCLLLIAPMWNWNFYHRGDADCRGLLLIAPMWNWNERGHFRTVPAGLLLIAPMWNWNSPLTFIVKLVDTVNRTNVELKCTIPCRWRKQTRLLIAPMWNWNATFESKYNNTSTC